MISATLLAAMLTAAASLAGWGAVSTDSEFTGKLTLSRLPGGGASSWRPALRGGPGPALRGGPGPAVTNYRSWCSSSTKLAPASLSIGPQRRPPGRRAGCAAPLRLRQLQRRGRAVLPPCI